MSPQTVLPAPCVRGRSLAFGAARYALAGPRDEPPPVRPAMAEGRRTSARDARGDPGALALHGAPAGAREPLRRHRRRAKRRRTVDAARGADAGAAEPCVRRRRPPPRRGHRPRPRPKRRSRRPRRDDEPDRPEPAEATPASDAGRPPPPVVRAPEPEVGEEASGRHWRGGGAGVILALPRPARGRSQ